MSLSRKPIGIVTLIPAISIDEDELKQVFPNLEVSEDTLTVSSFRHKKFTYSPQIDSALLLFSKKTPEGFTEFASAHTLDELFSKVNEIPDQFSKLRAQLTELCKRLDEISKSWDQIDLKEKALFNEYIEKINKIGVAGLCGNEIEFRGYASETELKQTLIVAEHACLIKSFAGFDNTYVGTYGLGTCIWLVAINSEKKLVVSTHLDEATIEKYRDSMENVFKLLSSDQSKTVVYLLGGIDSNSVTSLGDMRFSKTLVLSVEEFIKNRNDCYLAGTFLFKKEKNTSAYVLRINGMNELSFFRVDGQFEMLLSENAKNLLVNNQILGSPIYHRELTIVTDASDRVTLTSSWFKGQTKEMSEKKKTENLQPFDPKKTS